MSVAFDSQPTYSVSRNRHFLNGFCTVLHSHHYITLITQLALWASNFNGRHLLQGAAEDVFYTVLGEYFCLKKVCDAAEKTDAAQEYWRTIGMGLITFCSDSGCTIAAEMEHSHVDEGLMEKWVHTSPPTRPVNIIARGFVAAVCCLVVDRPPRSFEVRETKGLACGDDVSRFEAHLDSRQVADGAYLPVKSIHRPGPEKLTFSLLSNVDRQKVIDEMAKARIAGNEEGCIPAFGVYLQQLPSALWNLFARRLINSVPEFRIEAEYLLISAAQESGYLTGHDIMTSDIWKKVVGPMIRDVPEDVLHGVFAVFTAWGWAQLEIVELVPGERMVVRAYDYYEADLEAVEPSAYMIQGVCAALFDLAYGGMFDPTGEMGLGTFGCKQTMGIELGDPHGEFVVTK